MPLYLVREANTGTVRRCELRPDGFYDTRSDWTCQPDDVPAISFAADTPDSPLWFDDGPGDPVCEPDFPNQPR